MFSDIPGIDPDYEDNLNGPPRPQSECHPFSFHTLRSVARHGHSDPDYRRGSGSNFTEPHPGLDSGYHELSGCFGVSHHYATPNLPWGQLSSELYPQPEEYSTWLSRPGLPRRASPSSSFADGSVSEDGANVVPVHFSPTLAARDKLGPFNRRVAGSPAHTWQSSDDAHYDSIDYNSGSGTDPTHYGSGCSTSGIKMQDVQQYPDSYHEEKFDDADASEPLLAQANTHQLHLKPEKVSTKLPHDSRGSPSEADTMQDESSIDSDDDTMSDYLPQPRKKSRPIPSRRTFKTNAKESDKSKKLSRKHSKPYRVAKRSQKLATPAENAALSSNKVACPHCSQAVHSKAALNKHIATVHTRPFTCTFRMYGCTSTFGSKNEWKRHVSSQHLRFGFWRCNLGRCLPVQGSADSEDEEELIFNDFNRKDLFMQHLRRMHAPHTSSSNSDKAAFNSSLDTIAQQCFIAVRTPPPRSVCGYCAADDGKGVVFEGSGAWESRMEHVGRHLESGHGDEKTWVEDQNLKLWLINQSLIEGDESKGYVLTGIHLEDKARKR